MFSQHCVQLKMRLPTDDHTIDIWSAVIELSGLKKESMKLGGRWKICQSDGVNLREEVVDRYDQGTLYK